jgi:hypothetical protein
VNPVPILLPGAQGAKRTDRRSVTRFRP